VVGQAEEKVHEVVQAGEMQYVQFEGYVEEPIEVPFKEQEPEKLDKRKLHQFER